MRLPLRRSSRRAARGGLEPWSRVAVAVLVPFLRAFTRRDWRGTHHVPRTGGAVIVANHISHFDPLALAHFVYAAGRVPRFLAKSELFAVPFVRTVLRGARQIPVQRGSSDAARAYDAAVQAVLAGEVVCVYPEGTVTREPSYWPMSGKTGAARIALTTGVPVVPVALWGPQRVLPRGARLLRPVPGRTMHVVAGPPVPLEDLSGREQTADLLAEATERILAHVTALLETLRGERAPAVRFDGDSDPGGTVPADPADRSTA